MSIENLTLSELDNSALAANKHLFSDPDFLLAVKQEVVDTKWHDGPFGFSTSKPKLLPTKRMIRKTPKVRFQPNYVT